MGIYIFITKSIHHRINHTKERVNHFLETFHTNCTVDITKSLKPWFRRRGISLSCAASIKLRRPCRFSHHSGITTDCSCQLASLDLPFSCRYLPWGKAIARCMDMQLHENSRALIFIGKKVMTAVHFSVRCFFRWYIEFTSRALNVHGKKSTNCQSFPYKLFYHIIIQNYFP